MSQCSKALIEISKGVDEQAEFMETYGRGKKVNNSKDMLSALQDKVVKLEGFMGNVKETLEKVDRHTTKLESRQDQLKEQVVDAFNANANSTQGVFNTIVGELIKKNDAFKAVVPVLKEQNEELKE
ncbi:hypothetical protein J1N35_037038 [Gossypium stocksii]|uniref:Uncharacterized protein n=1 Tax=Gossypium stocksii TaxID=47602 RepID=A0A9D3UJZ7_9ROSI|nr:hypothetical protein J1N35_037038 [Gossypium stocksii]